MSGESMTETEVIERFRTAGLRMTQPRRAITRALMEIGHEFVTAARVQTAAEAQNGRLDLSTVYRTLGELHNLGLVHHVHHGSGQAGTWRLAAETDHQHLVCEGCGTMVEVPAEALEPTYAVLRESYGFRPSTHHFTILGFCSDCSSGEATAGDGT